MIGTRTITLVCCSHQRESALRATLANKLAVNGVDNLLFVLDGSSDGSAPLLEEARIADARVDFIEQPRRGVQAARNAALNRVRSTLTLFLDDDDFVPSDFAEVLVDKLLLHEAVAVGCPWLDKSEIDNAPILEPPSRHTISSSQSISYTDDILTPFINSNYLVRTELARIVQYDESYKGNAWREETDFFLRLWRYSPTIVRTSATYSWLESRYPGGHDRSRAKYEYWVLRNEYKFLRRHREIAQSLSMPTRPLPAALALSVNRISQMCLAYLGARVASTTNRWKSLRRPPS